MKLSEYIMQDLEAGLYGQNGSRMIFYEIMNERNG